MSWTMVSSLIALIVGAVAFVTLPQLDIWPYNASNAAVPLAAAFLGRLPTADDSLVKILGYVIFLLAFVPLMLALTNAMALARAASGVCG